MLRKADRNCQRNFLLYSFFGRKISCHFYICFIVRLKIPNRDHVESFSNRKANHSNHFSCIFQAVWFLYCISTFVYVYIFYIPSAEQVLQCSLWLSGSIRTCQTNWAKKKSDCKWKLKALKKLHEILNTFLAAIFCCFLFGSVWSNWTCSKVTLGACLFGLVKYSIGSSLKHTHKRVHFLLIPHV